MERPALVKCLQSPTLSRADVFLCSSLACYACTTFAPTKATNSNTQTHIETTVGSVLANTAICELLSVSVKSVGSGEAC